MAFSLMRLSCVSFVEWCHLPSGRQTITGSYQASSRRDIQFLRGVLESQRLLDSGFGQLSTLLLCLGSAELRRFARHQLAQEVGLGRSGA